MNFWDSFEFLQSINLLAEEAGRRILEIYHSDFQVSFKEDESPLTAADLSSHDCLVEGLKKIAPEYPILSEESSIVPFEERSHWETFWLIDPLDGTREFIKRNGEFTVNVALIHRNESVLGAVYAPAKEVGYFASSQGSFRKRGLESVERISVKKNVTPPLRILASRSHGREEVLSYLSRIGEHELLSIGSSLKFCLVAEGSADLYLRMGPTSEWDTAAAHCVLHKAGGELTDLQRKPLRYNKKPSLLNPNFMAFGDQSQNWTAPFGNKK